MNNKKKLKSVWVGLGCLIFIIVLFLLQICVNGVWRQSLENLTNGALAIVISVGFTIWKIDYNQKEDKKKKLRQESRKNQRTARLEIDSLLFLMDDFPNLVSENKRINVIKLRKHGIDKNHSYNNIIQNMLERVNNYHRELYKNIYDVERALILLESATDKEIEEIAGEINQLQADFYDLERDLDPNELKQFGFKFLQCKKENIISDMIRLRDTLSKLKIGQKQNYQNKTRCLNGYIAMTEDRSIVEKDLKDKGEVCSKDIAKKLSTKENNIALPQEAKRYSDGLMDKARFIIKLWVLHNDYLKDSKPYLNKKNPIVDFGRYNKAYGSYYLRISNSEKSSSDSDSTVYTKISWKEPTKKK